MEISKLLCTCVSKPLFDKSFQIRMSTDFAQKKRCETFPTVPPFRDSRLRIKAADIQTCTEFYHVDHSELELRSEVKVLFQADSKTKN